MRDHFPSEIFGEIRQSVGFQLALLFAGTRDDIIAWLDWNDRNGVYTDEDSKAAGLPILTLESARQQMRKVLDE